MTLQEIEELTKQAMASLPDANRVTMGVSTYSKIKASSLYSPHPVENFCGLEIHILPDFAEDKLYISRKPIDSNSR